ncbi:hypothetical protein [Lacisediminimonas profundi]|uniref:hypothetical protein n=1 Tax=Lacisediminimonas profundi TaxID=2603856 RepID=UPI00124B6624|nr:hypothetical protein [Lacisediminimonas profundi]
MFKRKNVLLAVAVSMLLAACGGGSDTPVTAVSSPAPLIPTATPPTADNSVLSGFLRLTSDQVMFSNTVITADQLASFPGDAGPFTTGTNAPLTQFGMRISPIGMDTADGQAKTARIAIDLTEKAASAAPGEQAEQLQLMIDKVTLTVSPAGAFSVAVPAGAKVYVHYVPATGAAVDATADAADLVRLDAVAGDGTSNMLVLDLETAITRALAGAAGLATAKNMAGKFDMLATLSNVAMRKADETTPVVGTSITVTNAGQAAVVGAGVAGVINVQ